MNDLLLVLLRSGAVLALALGAGRLAWRAPALRLAIYRVGLLGALVVAAASPWMRERSAPVVPVSWSPPPQVTYTVVKRGPAQTPVEVPIRQMGAIVEPSYGLYDLVPSIWAAGSGLLLLRLLLGYAALARLRRTCRAISLTKAAETALAMGAAIPAVVEGTAVGSPFVAGARKPTIFLPKGWSPEPDVLLAVLRHETAHVANGDLRWGLFYRLAAVALWPQPLLWLLKKPMEAAGEELCDAQALASGMPSARYAECLLSLRPGHAPALGIGAVASRSSLGRRVEAILDARRSRATRLSRPVSIALRLGALGLAAGTAFVFARPSQMVAVQDSTADWLTRSYAGRVRLVGLTGKPVVGARAWLVANGEVLKRPANALRVVGSEVVLQRIDHPEGTAGTLIVQAKGYGLGFAHLWPVPKPVTVLRLPPPASLTGRVVLPDGKPGAGLRVGITMLVGRREEGADFALLGNVPGLSLGSTTAADGTFRVDGLPPSTNVSYDVDDPRFAQSLYTDRANLGASGATRAKDLVLRPAARLTGRVTRNGTPIAGLRIGAQSNNDKSRLSDGYGDAVTDAQGRYAIERLPEGWYNVAADLQKTPEATAAAYEAVEAKAGTTVGNLDFDLIPGVLIEGRVTDDAGKPVRTTVGVYGPAHPRSSAWVQVAKSDADGRYRLRVPPGEQYVYLMDSVYSASQKGRTIQIDSGEQVVDFQVPQRVAPAGPKAPEAVAERRLDEEDPGPVPPIASFGPGKPFYGPYRLHTGGTVRLAYLQNDKEAPHTLWKPDGSPADPKDVAASLNMKGFSEADRAGAPRSVFARIEALGVKLDGFNCVVQVPHQSAWNVYQSYGDAENRTGDLATFRAPHALKVTDLRLGIGAGPWSVAWSGKPGGFARLGNGGGASVTVDLSPALQRRDVWMRAVDPSGRELELGSVASEDPDRKTGLAARTFEFQGSASEVARIDLLARDYEWVTFRGIQLYPK